MFKVGDIVVGNSKSNGWYSITCKNNNFVGVVVSVLQQHRIVVKLIKGNYGHIGDEFNVYSGCFELEYSQLIKFLKSLE